MTDLTHNTTQDDPFEDFDNPEKARALAAELEIDADDISESSYDAKTFKVGQQEYLVCTEDEADEVWDEQLDSYLDECVLPELPENVQTYFDRESWKNDAQMDGRGHSIASYDGDENDATDPISGEKFVYFRMN